MSPSHIASWALTAFLSGLLVSCGTDRTDSSVVAGNRSPDPSTPAATHTPAPRDSEVASYAETLRALEAFVERGRREVRSMGELPRQAAADPALYATQIDILEDAGCEWSDDLVLIEGGLPEEPAPQNRFAPVYRNLSRAIQELRQVSFTASGDVSGVRTPAAEERRKRIDAAESYLRVARRELEATAG
jgi:hypothetical protein